MERDTTVKKVWPVEGQKGMAGAGAKDGERESSRGSFWAGISLANLAGASRRHHEKGSGSGFKCDAEGKPEGINSAVSQQTSNSTKRKDSTETV